MTKTITKNNRTFEVEIEHLDCWNSKVTVFELFKDGSFKFCGKAVSNNIDYAVDELIK